MPITITVKKTGFSNPGTYVPGINVTEIITNNKYTNAINGITDENGRWISNDTFIFMAQAGGGTALQFAGNGTIVRYKSYTAANISKFPADSQILTDISSQNLADYSWSGTLPNITITNTDVNVSYRSTGTTNAYYSGVYYCIEFLTPDALNYITFNGSVLTKCLIVAGGGAGGNTSNVIFYGGGGGAGGVYVLSGYIGVQGQYETWNISVGLGGTNADEKGRETYISRNSSNVDNLTNCYVVAIGGGKGGQRTNGNNGGSGGGAPVGFSSDNYTGGSVINGVIAGDANGFTNKTYYGNIGGASANAGSDGRGGGGGGAGGQGDNGTSNYIGNGGSGYTWTFNGKVYAGGGGGGSNATVATGGSSIGGNGSGGSSDATNPTQNTGSGGGGGGYYNGGISGTNGANGIVIFAILNMTLAQAAYKYKDTPIYQMISNGSSDGYGTTNFDTTGPFIGMPVGYQSDYDDNVSIPTYTNNNVNYFGVTKKYRCVYREHTNTILTSFAVPNWCTKIKYIMTGGGGGGGGSGYVYDADGGRAWYWGGGGGGGGAGGLTYGIFQNTSNVYRIMVGYGGNGGRGGDSYGSIPTAGNGGNYTVLYRTSTDAGPIQANGGILADGGAGGGAGGWATANSGGSGGSGGTGGSGNGTGPSGATGGNGYLNGVNAAGYGGKHSTIGSNFFGGYENYGYGGNGGYGFTSTTSFNPGSSGAGGYVRIYFLPN